MTRAAATALVVIGALVSLASPVAAAESTTLGLSEAGNASFPNRSYVLSLPPGKLARPGQVHVSEDGTPVQGVSVIPASAASSHGFGVVLVIDTSRSMKGRPITDAFAAARAFARRRPPRQQLGIVTFNGTATVALPLTSDGAEIDRVLAKPSQLDRNTHIYDAVDTAVQMLGTARLKPASVVVLSDGSDTGSSTRAAQVEAHARSAGVRVFSVGLPSGAFDPGALRGLAAATRGAYTQANDPGDLARIYDELGARLANEYLVLYRSPAGPNHQAHVSVSVDGVDLPATTSYHTPPLRIALAPYNTKNFWATGGALFLASVLIALLLVATVYFALTRPGRRNVRTRVSQFVAGEPVPAPDPIGTPNGSPGLFLGFGRAFHGMRWWPKFEEEVDVAAFTMPATQLAGITAVGTLLFLGLLTLSGTGALGIVLALALPFGVRRFVSFKAQRERKRFSDQLADNLQVIASALRAGHSLVSAMAVAVTDAPQPTKREFERVLADEKLGVPLENGMAVVARRMENRDLEQVTLVASLQRDTGGNTAEVLDRVADTVRERQELRRLVATLTAQGRMSRWVVTALPIVLTLVISAMSPTYLEPLFHTTAGQVMLAISVVLLISGSLAIKKIVNIKV